MSTSTASSKPSSSRTPRADVAGVSWKFWLGLLVVVGATGFIVTSSMSSTVHYYNVNEVAGNATFVGERMRLRGFVVDGSHRVRQGTLDEHIFVLGTDQRTVTVLYTGALPDQFQDGAEVIATGELTGDDVLEAEEITAQCPSRYENAAPTAEGNREAMGGGGPSPAVAPSTPSSSQPGASAPDQTGPEGAPIGPYQGRQEEPAGSDHE